MSMKIPPSMFPKHGEWQGEYAGGKGLWAVCFSCLRLYYGVDQREVSSKMAAHVSDGSCAAERQSQKGRYPASFCLKHDVRFDREGESCGACSNERPNISAGPPKAELNPRASIQNIVYCAPAAARLQTAEMVKELQRRGIRTITETVFQEMRLVAQLKGKVKRDPEDHDRPYPSDDDLLAPDV